MRWTEVETGDRGGAHVRTTTTPDIRVDVTRAAWNHLLEHISASQVEEGGILLGAVEELAGPDGVSTLRVVVREAMAADRREACATHFSFVPGTWEGLLRKRRAAGSVDRIVGWYHSHPRLGAFFSGTDRTTQRACFRQPWQVGLVVDPFLAQAACFVGPSSRPPSCWRILDAPPEQAPPQALLRAAETSRLVRRIYPDPALVLVDGTRHVLVGLVGPSHAGRGRRAARLRRHALHVLRRQLLRPPACVLPSARGATTDDPGRALPHLFDRIVSTSLPTTATRPARPAGTTSVGWQVAEELVRRGLAVVAMDRAVEAAGALHEAQRTACRRAHGVWKSKFRRERLRMLAAAGRQ